MATVNISLPSRMAKQIDQLTRQKGYSSRSELVRDLLREKLTQGVADFKVFEKRPLSEVRKELKKTGKYSKQFIDSVVSGLQHSSLYATRD